jgi:hypothetical protein
MGELILGKASANRHERSKIGCQGSGLEMMRIGPQSGCHIGPQDSECQRIVEDRRMIEQLMRGPMQGDSLGSVAGLGWEHKARGKSVPSIDLILRWRHVR